MSPAEFNRRFRAVEEQLSRDGLVPCLWPVEAWVAMAMIQLALRHPGNIGPSSKIARGVVERIQRMFAVLDPELGRIAEQGNHAVFDQEWPP